MATIREIGAEPMARAGKQYRRIALAYSGGLDTSVIIPWLRENYQADVIAVVADVGQDDDLQKVHDKAIQSGAEKCYVVDVKETFLTDYVFPALRAGALYEGKYLLGTALARPLIGRVLVDVAKQEGCDAVAHGATGKGNDQVRFEAAVAALAPELGVIAPWREWELRSRDDALAYAAKHQIPVDATPKAKYSRDGNLLHISHEGDSLEDPWLAPEPDVLQRCVWPEQAPDEPQDVLLSFREGLPVAVDGVDYAGDPIGLMLKLNETAGRHGVGIVDMVENRLVGMKSRGVYETPGGTLIFEALRGLEMITLDRDALALRYDLAQRYARLVYDGLWFSEVRAALDAALTVLTRPLTGDVRARLYKGSVRILGVRSPETLYDPELSTFDEGAVEFDHADAGGFIRLFTLPLATVARRRQAAAAQRERGE